MQATIGQPVFELNNAIWHMRIYRAPDGTAIVERLRGPKRTKPATWPSPRTPEEWVRVQRDGKKYVPVGN
jgi:hypothetical protein